MSRENTEQPVGETTKRDMIERRRKHKVAVAEVNRAMKWEKLKKWMPRSKKEKSAMAGVVGAGIGVGVASMFLADVPPPIETSIETVPGREIISRQGDTLSRKKKSEVTKAKEKEDINLFEYTVREDQDMVWLEDHFGVNEKDLEKANSGVNLSKGIKSGEKIRIPGLKKGELLYVIDLANSVNFYLEKKIPFYNCKGEYQMEHGEVRTNSVSWLMVTGIWYLPKPYGEGLEPYLILGMGANDREITLVKAEEVYLNLSPDWKEHMSFDRLKDHFKEHDESGNTEDLQLPEIIS